LTALIGQLETVRMKRDTMPRVEQDRFIDGAFNNAQHLKRLVVALAELGRLDDPAFAIEMEPIALHELCDDVTYRFQTHAESLGVQLTVAYPDGLPLAQVDAGLIERALSNLLDNALRLTPAGGSVAVDIAEAAFEDRPALRVSVSDSGPGIALPDQGRVFDRFFQSSEHRGLRGSSGLGLAIVARVAELHGGEAGVTSRSGKGAVFHLLLPIRPRGPDGRPPIERPVRGSGHGAQDSSVSTCSSSSPSGGGGREDSE
jgi:signal transduction histidine kinase